MGTFLLISVLVHLAVMLFAPPIVNRAGAQFPSLLSGGVVQVVRVDEPVASQRTTPQRVAQERRATPAQRQETRSQSPSQTERQSTPAQRPEAEPKPEPAIQAPAQEKPAEQPLTSPQGAEPVPEARTPQAATQKEPERQPKPEARSEPAEQTAPTEAGTARTSEPAAEPVPEDPGPPALPPLGEPGSLINLGSTSLGYPKNAENEGLEGAVEVRLELDAAGNVQRVLLVRPSGHRVLDEYAMRALTVQAQNRAIRGSSQAAPYAVHARVTFRREGNAFVGHVELVGTAEYLQER